MVICRALLKHGYSNFDLYILEYCDSKDLLKREQYYIDLMNPEYNILKKARSSLGFKHREETIAKMSISKAGEKNPMFGKLGVKHPMFGKTGEKNPMFGKPRPEGSGSPSQQIEVIDIKNNITTTYDSISAAALALNIKQPRISMYFSRNQNKPYKSQYIFKKL
jgi:group I intron endonuclease